MPNKVLEVGPEDEAGLRDLSALLAEGEAAKREARQLRALLHAIVLRNGGRMAVPSQLVVQVNANPLASLRVSLDDSTGELVLLAD